MEELELSYTAGGKVKQYDHFGNQFDSFFFCCLFKLIYLFWLRRVLVAACGLLSWGMHAGSSSPTRDRTRAPCIDSMESYPLDHQGSPQFDSFLAVKPTPGIWSSHSTPKYLHKRKYNLCLYKDLHMNVHSSFICNSQKLETTQMSINSKHDISIQWNTTQQ